MSSKYKIVPPLTRLQQDVLIGSLLGDGSLSKSHGNKGNARFCKTQMANKKEYIQWHFQIFTDYATSVQPIFSTEKLFSNNNGTIGRMTTNQKKLTAYRFRSISHPVFTEIQNQWYPQGIKTIPLNLELNPQQIAIWFCDDGTNNLSHRSATIFTNAFTFEEMEVIKTKFRIFDLFPTIRLQVSKYGKRMPILGFYGSSYDGLISLIKPHIHWSCFLYKTKWRPAIKQWEYSSKLNENQVIEIIKLSKNKKKSELREIADKFKISPHTVYKIAKRITWKHLIVPTD